MAIDEARKRAEHLLKSFKKKAQSIEAREHLDDLLRRFHDHAWVQIIRDTWPIASKTEVQHISKQVKSMNQKITDISKKLQSIESNKSNPSI